MPTVPPAGPRLDNSEDCDRDENDRLLRDHRDRDGFRGHDSDRRGDEDRDGKKKRSR